jgi:fatty-acyl-CoA synthase
MTGPTLDMGVGSWIERRARMTPDRLALIGAGRSLTYAQLARRIRLLANGLREAGVHRGDRVAWLGDNHPAFLESLFATALLGGVLAPVNHRLPDEDRAWVLEDTEPVVVIEHHAAPSTRLPRSVRHRLAVGGSRDDAQDYEALIDGGAEGGVGATVALDDLLMLPHTSGTSGRPKGVMLTHGNVTWNVIHFISSADFRGDDVTVAIAPLFRVGGTGVNVLPVLFVGGTVVVPEHPDAEAVLAAIEQHRVSVGFANPDLLDALVRSSRWPGIDLSCLRFIITGGAPVPERLFRAFLDRGVPLVQGYGLSEAAPLALILDMASATSRIGSAGRPPLFVDIRIVDPSGADVPVGGTGELLVRGPNVMAGYWRRPAETSEVLRDGWLHTGDAARRDDEGFVWIVDRVSARFGRDGSVVYPGDVERVLLTHPAVADVGVVGVDAGPRGSGGVAFIVRQPGGLADEAEVIAFARERLPEPAVPVAVRWVDELPRSTVGKLRREDLRAMAVGSEGPVATE